MDWVKEIKKTTGATTLTTLCAMRVFLKLISNRDQIPPCPPYKSWAFE
jgi:hypothetical protein